MATALLLLKGWSWIWGTVVCFHFSLIDPHHHPLGMKFFCIKQKTCLKSEIVMIEL